MARTNAAARFPADIQTPKCAFIPAPARATIWAESPKLIPTRISTAIRTAARTLPAASCIRIRTAIPARVWRLLPADIRTEVRTHVPRGILMFIPTAILTPIRTVILMRIPTDIRTSTGRIPT